MLYSWSQDVRPAKPVSEPASHTSQSVQVTAAVHGPGCEVEPTTFLLKVHAHWLTWN